MTVAIVHYHLKRGGVTNVIEAQSRVLTEAGIEHVIFSGSPYQGELPLPVVVEPDLNYRDADAAPRAASDLLATMESAARTKFGKTPDLWHFHNHSLGKNPLYTELVSVLSKQGAPLLLQLHDFAADGRPDNFETLAGTEEIYPQAPHVHYAFINSRDRTLLTEAGLSANECHSLPNAVVPPSIRDEPVPSSHPTVLYPVRGIRRKNLGEICLMAAMAPPQSQFAVSITPHNQQWITIHDRWQKFASSRSLPVKFGAVDRVPPAPGVEPSFENWLSHSSHLITTSIAEGFGLAFLEPIALGKPLIGRDLPEITRDFKESGLKLGNLYQSISIPLDLLNQPRLRAQMTEDLGRAYQSFKRDLTPEIIEQTWEALTCGGTIDFGNLPESFQESVIETILDSPGILPISRWLHEALEERSPHSEPSMLDAYGLPAYQEKLCRLYQLATSSTPEAPSFLSKQSVLDQFLSPERFHFLRT